MKVKEILAETFDKIGGVRTFAEWARKNQTDFYRMVVKLLPIEHEVSGKEGTPLYSEVVRVIVEPRSDDA